MKEIEAYISEVRLRVLNRILRMQLKIAWKIPLSAILARHSNDIRLKVLLQGGETMSILVEEVEIIKSVV